MIALRNARLRLAAAQEGIAMVMVIGVGAVMTLLIVGAVALSLGSMNKADNDQDWNGALAAAFAGIEEYQSRLAEEPGYVQYGNPDSLFSNPNNVPDADSTVELPVEENPAFGVNASGTWAVAADAGGVERFRFRYEVDNSKYYASGTVRLRSTGLVGGQTRSIVADVRQTGFIDYLYFTDLEMIDPSIPSAPSCPTIHTWEGRGGCTIQFGGSDLIEGPVHSNDTLYICGSTFKQTVTTGKPGGGYAVPGSCGTPTFTLGPPIYSPSVAMPATNTELIKETRSDLPDTVPRPGCLYTGPTQITFLAAGKMNVKSPWTLFTNIVGDPVTSGDNANAAQCGSISDLHSASGATLPVLENNLVFVQNIPLTGTNSSTTTQTQTSGTTPRCKNLAGASLTSTAGYSQNVIGFPAATEVPQVSGTGATASFGCRNGDLFISGQLSGGAMTVAAQNYVYITGDITRANNDTDMLGIIGQNAVWVYNPINSSGTFLLASNRRIDAAILSVAHTFTVQNYNTGSTRGTLTVNGSIAQKFRGPVGNAGGSGYIKSYLYDPRYRYSAPPKFLSPVTTTYGINVWVETSPTFKVDGTYR